MRNDRFLKRIAFGILAAAILTPEAHALQDQKVAVTEGHKAPVGIRDAVIPYEGPDTDRTVAAGIAFAAKAAPKGCGKDPYKRGIQSPCHPLHAFYLRTGDVLKEVLTKAGITPGDEELERYRLTIVMEGARAGMEYVTAMAVSENRLTHEVSWVQLEQHYSLSIDDPRTMSVYVDVGRTERIPQKRILQAIDFVDAYRRGIYARYFSAPQDLPGAKNLVPASLGMRPGLTTVYSR